MLLMDILGVEISLKLHDPALTVTAKYFVNNSLWSMLQDQTIGFLL